MADLSETARTGRRHRHEAIRHEVAAEESEAAEAEAIETSSALDVAMHLRIDKDLADHLRQRADLESIPISALVRRLLRQAMGQLPNVLTADEVADIARRVAREELANR